MQVFSLLGTKFFWYRMIVHIDQPSKLCYKSLHTANVVHINKQIICICTNSVTNWCLCTIPQKLLSENWYPFQNLVTKMRWTPSRMS